MPQKRRNYSPEYRTEAVKRVLESSRPVAQVAPGLGILEGTLGNWVAAYRGEHGYLVALTWWAIQLTAHTLGLAFPATGRALRRVIDGQAS